MLSRRVFSTSLLGGVIRTPARFQATSNPVVLSGGQQAPDVSYDQVWSLWNEGNLFSLTLSQLQGFLSKQGVPVDAASKKAALVRSVEDILQKSEKRNKPGGAPSKDGHGQWENADPQVETLLDLHQAGFYQQGTVSMAPKAFQLLVAGNTPDLVVSRVSTTAFPGFPSNAECYTLSAANADLALRARFSKALQWCAMNMKNLGLDGELTIQFGKLIIKTEASKRNRKIVSAWTLQQRVQVGPQPMFWVTTVPARSTEAIQAFLKTEGFQSATKSSRFDAHIKRAKDTVIMQVDGTGTPKEIEGQPTLLLQSHVIAANGGVDARISLRCRTTLPKEEEKTFLSSKIFEVQKDSDDIRDVLPPHLGQLVYLSEFDEQTFERVTAAGVKQIIKEVRRTPLIIVRDEEEGERIEYTLSAAVHPRTDLNAAGNELFDFAAAFSEVASPGFLEEYATTPQPVSIDLE